MNIDLYKMDATAATSILKTTIQAAPSDAGTSIKELVQRTDASFLGKWAEDLDPKKLEQLFTAAASVEDKNDKGDLVASGTATTSAPAPKKKTVSGGKKPAAKKAVAKTKAKASAKKPAAKKAAPKKKAAKAKAETKAPPHVDAILKVMKPGVSLKKAEIVASSGLSAAQFAASMNYLKGIGRISMQGERGNARYAQLANGAHA